MIYRRRCPLNFQRFLSTDSKAYSKTLLLPKTPFPQWIDPQKSEKPFRDRTTTALYDWQEKSVSRPLFVLHDGPPYANGPLHMGHALNKILKDIINRFQLLQGKRINYIPGWDCHGLPIENKALKDMKLKAHETPPVITRRAARSVAEREMQRQSEEFQEFGIMADWSQKGTYRTLDKSYELRQLRIFAQMVENGLIYRHFRPVHYSPSSRSALAEAELIYRDDHRSQSVYVYFKLKVSTCDLAIQEFVQKSNLRVLVWTTTPWTLSANMAVAVNPSVVYMMVKLLDDSGFVIVAEDRLDFVGHCFGSYEEVIQIRGSDLVGVQYEPIFPSALKKHAPYRIIPASHVTSDSGTGLVHVAPAHGAEDYAAFLSMGLLDARSEYPLLCHVDERGCFSSAIQNVVGDILGKDLVGLEVLKAGTTTIIDVLKLYDALAKEEPIVHRYPYDWKTDQPIIVTATSQWFANLDAIKERALTTLETVNFFPPASRTRLQSFISTRSEWCISRQRPWGVPIPSLHHIPTKAVVLERSSLDHILSILDTKGVDYWWEGPVEEFVSEEIRRSFEANGFPFKSSDWVKGMDTMDVWFDSGSSWTLLRELGLRKQVNDAFYADVCLEGSDQHRGWFQSMLLTSSSVTGSKTSGDRNDHVLKPYKNLITHGMVLDQEGKKMSKSLGNVISPLVVVNGGKNKKIEPAYGADVLRFWAASVEYWRDMALGPTVLSQSSEALRKIRNSIRFALGNINSVQYPEEMNIDRASLSIVDRYVMHELYKLERLALQNYENFNFPRIVSSVSNFANVTLSSLYFDIMKDALYADSPESPDRRAVAFVLKQILETMVNIMAPITPHLAEEAYHYAQSSGPERLDESSVFMRPWNRMSDEWLDPSAEIEMSCLMPVREGVLKLLEQGRAAKQLRSSLEAEVDIIIPNDIPSDNNFLRVLRREEAFIKTLCIVSDAHITDEVSLGANVPQWVYSSSVALRDEGVIIGIRARPSSREKCPRCWMYTRQSDDSLCHRCSSAIPQK
ncbi:isoleucyl-tRNA synthetase [Schizopora paradoxa]|uniref:Isoleucine--tRNA ligase, mitochondrial n=1 Tax=Schizopora paradoxa TaxID=27342 RepID=A0A0H2SKP3_9AGAM|nr:isoleucyl-tRNA synthetase [Schizopora paradoxa]